MKSWTRPILFKRVGASEFVLRDGYVGKLYPFRVCAYAYYMRSLSLSLLALSLSSLPPSQRSTLNLKAQTLTGSYRVEVLRLLWADLG